MQKINIAFHQVGARRNYSIPLTLHQQDLLYKLFTDFYTFSWMLKGAKKIEQISNNNLFLVNNLSKRRQDELPDDKICSLQWQLFLLNFEKKIFHTKETYLQSQKISLAVAQLMEKNQNDITHIYCYTWNARNCRSVIKNAMIITDQIQAIMKSFIPMFEKEFQDHSDWVKEKNLLAEVKELWTENEKEDMEATDYFFAPSEFIKESLINDLGVDSKKVYLNPYPAPFWLCHFNTSLNNDSSRISRNKQQGELLKILFVGSVDLRKGIPYLLKSLRKLNPNHFTARIVGSIGIHDSKVKEYSDICTFMGKLNKQELAKQYEWANVFVFPSLAEGSAGVIYEAMTFGLPVITTKSSGSWVRDGIDGVIVQERNIEHLVESLLVYINNPLLLESHGQNAWERVKSFNIEQTGIRFKNIFSDI
jgi:glycosyltransferase involved in cell wall biosynthesis